MNPRTLYAMTDAERRKWHSQSWFAELGLDGLATRIAGSLVEAGIETPEQLSRMSDAELLRLPNFGRKSLRRVRERFCGPFAGRLCPTCHGRGLVYPEAGA